MKQYASLIVTLAFLLIFSLWAQSGFLAYRELELGRQALYEQNTRDALSAFRRSMSQQTLFLPFAQDAAFELEQIIRRENSTEENTEKSSPELRQEALAHYASAIATRRSWILESLREDPFKQRYFALEQAYGKKIPAATIQQADAYTPKPIFFLVAQAGFFLWIGAVLMFIFRALQADGSIHWRTGLSCCLGFVLGFGIWVLGLLWA